MFSSCLKGHGFVIANNASDRFLYGDTGSGRRLYGDINGVITTSNINISSYSESAYQIHEFSLNSGIYGSGNGTQEYQRANTTGNFKIDRIAKKWDGTTSMPMHGRVEIGEIIAVGTTTERAKIEGYLAYKWGLTSSLPTSHPYKSSQPSGNGSTSSDVLVSGAYVSSISGSGATYTSILSLIRIPPGSKITIAEGAAVSSANGERNQVSQVKKSFSVLW